MKVYKCESCGYIIDVEEPPHTCPVCGAPEICFVDIEQGEKNEQ